MDPQISKQIIDLNELQSLNIKLTGDYKDINLALSALKICSIFGLELTSKIINMLHQSNINTYEDVQLLISDDSKHHDKLIFKKESGYYCPTCNNKINMNNVNNYCSNCGQKLKNEKEEFKDE